jgi:YjbE family integral membrane protein
LRLRGSDVAASLKEAPMSMSSPEFWIALLEIIGVNIVLSGDNAVVIALAARSLPADQQRKAVAWGSGAAVVMRIVLTFAAVELLRLPYLKLLGAGLLLWIAVQLLLPEKEGEGHAAAGTTLLAAIKTILVADLVMSLDNVIAVAAAANGSGILLVVGLGVSIPLVVFASTVLLKLMTRFPIIVTIGAGLLGWVAGEMTITDPATVDWVNAQWPMLHYVAPALGALSVLTVGKWLAARGKVEHVAVAGPAPETPAGRSRARSILLAIDGTPASHQAVEEVLAMRRELRDPSGLKLHLVNIQHGLPGDVSKFVENKALREFHHEQGSAALREARDMLDGQGVDYEVHEAIGDPSTTITQMATDLGCNLIVMGYRHHDAAIAKLMGSVAQRTLELTRVPVLLAC